MICLAIPNNHLTELINGIMHCNSEYYLHCELQKPFHQGPPDNRELFGSLHGAQVPLTIFQ